MSTSINEEQQYISFNSTGSNNSSANLPSMSNDKYMTTYDFLQWKKCCGPGVECILLDKTADIQTTPRIVFIMKKNKQSNNSAKKENSVKSEDKATESGLEATRIIDSLDDENQGFGGWLRSDDGMETMKLFIIANSIVLMTTLVYPHLRTAVEILGEMVYGVEEAEF